MFPVTPLCSVRKCPPETFFIAYYDLHPTLDKEEMWASHIFSGSQFYLFLERSYNTLTFHYCFWTFCSHTRHLITLNSFLYMRHVYLLLTIVLENFFLYTTCLFDTYFCTSYVIKSIYAFEYASNIYGTCKTSQKINLLITWLHLTSVRG